MDAAADIESRCVGFGGAGAGAALVDGRRGGGGFSAGEEMAGIGGSSGKGSWTPGDVVWASGWLTCGAEPKPWTSRG